MSTKYQADRSRKMVPDRKQSFGGLKPLYRRKWLCLDCSWPQTTHTTAEVHHC